VEVIDYQVVFAFARYYKLLAFFGFNLTPRTHVIEQWTTMTVVFIFMARVRGLIVHA
jgi:hypothetical protein